ncbi:hypothetical protein XELAEV_18043470mg [Xenopus laevis]|uniref:Uncharacterized protein n=1 Tax=Xenopus laevis TaxID=8355 RepID=A0A974H2D8_XENLA|nr:hypothetical protein XELAEV_18043470mg [Xenopus laevis]
MQLGETPPLQGRGEEGQTGVQGWREVLLSGWECCGQGGSCWQLGRSLFNQTGRERRCQAARDLVNKLSISRELLLLLPDLMTERNDFRQIQESQ